MGKWCELKDNNIKFKQNTQVIKTTLLQELRMGWAASSIYIQGFEIKINKFRTDLKIFLKSKKSLGMNLSHSTTTMIIYNFK